MSLGQLRNIIAEAIMPVREPKTPEQAKATLDLVKWASTKMSVSDQEIANAVKKAQLGDWADALDILSTYYVMKGVTAPGRRQSLS